MDEPVPFTRPMNPRAFFSSIFLATACAKASTMLDWNIVIRTRLRFFGFSLMLNSPTAFRIISAISAAGVVIIPVQQATSHLYGLMIHWLTRTITHTIELCIQWNTCTRWLLLAHSGDNKFNSGWCSALDAAEGAPPDPLVAGKGDIPFAVPLDAFGVSLSMPSGSRLGDWPTGPPTFQMLLPMSRMILPQSRKFIYISVGYFKLQGPRSPVSLDRSTTGTTASLSTTLREPLWALQTYKCSTVQPQVPDI